MVSPIQFHLPTQGSVPRFFNEGAASTANKVATFVTAVLASLASFFFLSAEGAVLASLGALALFTMIFFTSRNRVQPNQVPLF